MSVLLAAQRKTQQVNLFLPERVEKRNDVASHAWDGIGRLASRARYTGVVKQNDGPIFREPICHLGIPVVEAAAEVLQKHDGSSRRCPKLPVGIPGAIRPEELRFCCVVCVAHNFLWLE